MELHELSALELADAVRRREVSAVEVARHALERAERLGPAVGAFACLAGERALCQAEGLDRRSADGADIGPLAGVPCPIKDLNPVAGLPFECGSAAMAGNVAEDDDPVAVWLAEAGTLMVGKTNTPEFGLPCYTEPDNAPPARTPWDPSCSAGGSSGGAAAAVACGIVPMAHGSDGGGSIRIPASVCGLVGLKASRGRINPGPPAMPGPGLATHGVLTRTVRDTAAGLDVLSRPQTGAVYQAPPWPLGPTLLEACQAPLGRLKVGLLTTPVIADAPVHPACLEAVGAAAVLLEGLGCEIAEAPVPFDAERWSAFAALWSVGALEIPVPAKGRLRPLTSWLREQGRGVSGLEHARALEASQRLAWDVARAWQGFDVVVTPTLAQPPAKVGQLRDDADPAADFAAQTRFTPWTSVYNVSGLPAVSLPLHSAVVDGRRLPIGVMLGGRFGREDVLLALAARLEDAGAFVQLAPPD
ncbi:MAG: amidase [Propionibacteriaceae bacterium]|nr:amidase [Propionibacteriaceae bacterium]